MRPVIDPTGHQVPRTKPTCLLHTWRSHRQRSFALVLHLHQHESSRNLHLQYLAKNQSTQRCQSLITQGSDLPSVLEPHMVLRSSALRGLREIENQVGSVRRTRWTAGLGVGHMVARRARRSRGRSSRCTVAVESRGLAGGWAEHVGFGGLPTKPSEDGFLVWASKSGLKAQHDRDGIRACREASKRRTRGGIAWLASGGRGVRRRHGRPMARPTNIT
jgi:hypothetical protein